MRIIIHLSILIQHSLLRPHRIPIVSEITRYKLLHIRQTLKQLHLVIVIVHLISHGFLTQCPEPRQVLLCLANERPEFLNLQEGLRVDLLTGQSVEALFEPIEGVSLGGGLFDKVAELAVKLDLEDTRVHEKLHGVGV